MHMPVSVFSPTPSVSLLRDHSATCFFSLSICLGCPFCVGMEISTVLKLLHWVYVVYMYVTDSYSIVCFLSLMNFKVDFEIFSFALPDGFLCTV